MPGSARRLAAAGLVAGCLLAGCGSAVKSVVGSLPSRTATARSSGTLPVRPSVTVTASPSSTATETAPTSTATVTAPPSTATATVTAPAPAVSPSSPATARSGTSLVWLWVALAAVILAGLIGWIIHMGRRRSATAASWQSRFIDAYAKGAALHDAISVAEIPGALAAADAGARWADIQRRADDLAQVLYGLHEAVPGEGDRRRTADALASLHAVRSAMEAERAAGGADAEQAGIVRSRLGAFESSMRALRAGDGGSS